MLYFFVTYNLTINKTFLGETGCLNLVFIVCSSIQFFISPPSPNTVCEDARGSLLLIVPDLHNLKDAMSHHGLPSAFHPNPCLGKYRISLGVARILTMCLCSDSKFTSHQKVLLCRFYLCVRDCYRILC